MKKPPPVNLLLDSSVIAKWFLDEPGSERAVELRTRFLSGSLSLAYADLSLVEVSNALLFSNQFNTDEISDAIFALTALNMRRFSLEHGSLRRAVILAGHYGLTIYDSYLVALAEEYQLLFLTADHRLLRRLPFMDFVHDFERFPN